MLAFEGKVIYPGCCRDGVCYLRIFKPAGRIVAIVSELEENEGTCIANICEDLATRVCQRFQINADELRWVDHYPARPATPEQLRRGESFCFVRFVETPNGFADPDFEPTSKSAVQELIRGDFQPVYPLNRSAVTVDLR
jgi:hypothetical protein